MKTLRIHLTLFLIGLIAGAGCQTKPKIDWDAWIDTANYDEVVRRLGPPEKETRLSDGSRIGDWFLSRGQLVSNFHTMPDGRVMQGHVQQSPDRLVRLTFDKGDVLRHWERVYR